MKATITQPVERTVTVSMTEAEAKQILGFLHCNFAGLGFHRSAPARLGQALYKELHKEYKPDEWIYDDPAVQRGRVVKTEVRLPEYAVTVHGDYVGEMK